MKIEIRKAEPKEDTIEVWLEEDGLGDVCVMSGHNGLTCMEARFKTTGVRVWTGDSNFKDI